MGWLDTIEIRDEIMLNFYRGLLHINPLYSATNSQEYKSYTEIYRGTQRYTELYRGTQRYTEVHRGIQRYTEVYRGIQRYTEVHRGIQRYTRL